MIKIYYHNSKAPKANQPIIPSVHGVIINAFGEILLHRREDSPLWAFPGGKIESEESIKQCLEREIQEELGVTVCAKQLLGVYTDPAYLLALDNKVHRVFLIVFLCNVVQGSLILTNETVEYKWFKKSEIDSIKAFPLVKDIALNVFNGNKETFFD